MRIYFKNNPPKFTPNPIWQDGAFWEGLPDKHKNNEEQHE